MREVQKTSPLLSILQEEALQEGFALASGFDLKFILDPQYSETYSLFEKHKQHYQEWMTKNFYGEMQYLHRGLERRLNPELVFPSAKSVFCVALSYSSQDPSPAQGPRYARYLRGQDYHEVIKEKLDRVLVRVQQREGFSGLQWKTMVDTSAVLERTLGFFSGLGWIGKNTMLIHPQIGSYFFLGETFLSLPLDQAPQLLPNYCGNCERCLQACPPRAFQQSGVLDARKCTSYRTLERRTLSTDSETPFSDPGSQGLWVAGCDVCQEVCPFNQKVSKQKTALLDSVLGEKSWVELLLETEEAYLKRVEDSALNRVRYTMAQRNLSTALENALIQKTVSENDLESLILALNSKVSERGSTQWLKCLELAQAAFSKTYSVELNGNTGHIGKAQSNAPVLFG